MSVEKTERELGTLLKDLLKLHSLSMRRLSTLTGIDPATISRIANGKQQAKPEHLRQFARHLDVSLEQLLRAAGFELEREQLQDQRTEMHISIDTIQDVLLSSNLIDQQYTTKRVEQELTRYEKYALTKEGERLITDEFQSKVEQVSGAGPFIDQLKRLYTRFCQEGINQKERALIGSALLYFILATDIIPDYVFPIGYLDDAIAVQLVLQRLSQLEESERSEEG